MNECNWLLYFTDRIINYDRFSLIWFNANSSTSSKKKTLVLHWNDNISRALQIEFTIYYFFALLIVILSLE